MEVVSTGRPPATQGAGCRLALAVADANWYTTENLFGAIRRTDVSTLLLKCINYYNAWQRGLPPWAWRRALRQRGPGLWEHDLVLPSGWMRRFPWLGMRPIERSIHRWRSAHAGIAPLVLVMTYPHYLYLRDMVRPDLHVYFNVDDYSQYWPRFASQVNVLERQAVREADLTVCVSSVRADELRAAIPEAAEKIRHLPHGSTDVSLSDHPWERPAPAPDDLSLTPSSPPRLCRDPGRPDRLGPPDSPQRGLPSRLDRHRGPLQRPSSRRLVRRLPAVCGAAERPPARQASPGGHPSV